MDFNQNNQYIIQLFSSKLEMHTADTNSHSQGTCVPFSVSIIHSAKLSTVQGVYDYFQGIHASGEVYELNGLHVI